MNVKNRVEESKQTSSAEVAEKSSDDEETLSRYVLLHGTERGTSVSIEWNEKERKGSETDSSL